jgi:hypothetical protein
MEDEDDTVRNYGEELCDYLEEISAPGDFSTGGVIEVIWKE